MSPDLGGPAPAGERPDRGEPAPRRRTGGRSERVRRAVLEAALDVLTTDGLEGLSVAVIAQRSGVHETSIYRRWGTALAVALDAAAERVRLEVPVPDTGTLRGDLLLLVRDVAAFVDAPLGRTLVRLGQRDDLPEVEAIRDRFWAARMAEGTAVLTRAVERGQLAGPTPSETLVEVLVAPVYLRLFFSRRPVDDAYLNELTELVLGAITAARPAPRGRVRRTPR